MSFDKEKMLQLCNDWCKNTLMETLEIEYIDAGEDFLTAKMPVNSRVHQPMGLLHGGATVPWQKVLEVRLRFCLLILKSRKFAVLKSLQII